MLTLQRRTLVVNLVDGRTTLIGRRLLSWPWQVRLDGVQMHRGPDGGSPVDGTVVIPRHRIDWMQVVG